MKFALFCLSCVMVLAGWTPSYASAQEAGRTNPTLTKTDAFEAPKLIRSAPPEFPSIARQMEKSGTVNVAIVVGTDGKVSKATIASTTDPMFNDAALKAVKQWVFSPAKKNGKFVAVALTIPLVFDLRRR